MRHGRGEGRTADKWGRGGWDNAGGTAIGGATVGGDEGDGFRAAGARTVERYVTEGGREAGEGGGAVVCGQAGRWKDRVAKVMESGNGVDGGVGGVLG